LSCIVISFVYESVVDAASFATIRLSVTISICKRRPRVRRVTHADCDDPVRGA
jgi:hypothetical protein